MLSAIVCGTLLSSISAGQQESRLERAEADRQAQARAAFLDCLRSNFEDIHDVSMRFHLKDPSIGGLIVLRMSWANGRLSEAEVLENQTGVPEEAQAILAKIRQWEIPEILEVSTFTIPLRIRLVGSEDPDFPNTGIITGRVIDETGTALAGAEVRFLSSNGTSLGVPDAKTNREGVFIRTLVPPGTWTVASELEGHRSASTSDIQLGKGEHREIELLLGAEDRERQNLP